MKTTLIFGMLAVAMVATVLVPTGSALTCSSPTDPLGDVDCQLHYTWVYCNGNAYRGDYVRDHPGVLLGCL